MSAWKHDLAMDPTAWEPEQPDERDYEPGLPLQYEYEPEEYGVMEQEHDPLQAAYDAMLANIDMAVKCIRKRIETEQKGADKAEREGDHGYAEECKAVRDGLIGAIAILIDRGVWHDQGDVK